MTDSPTPSTPRRRGRRSQARGAAGWVVPLVILAVVIALAALSSGGRSSDRAVSTGGTSSEGETAAPELATRAPDDPRALGPVDAPVVMVEYSDFQCPFCGRFARETKPLLIEEYVDAGLLRIEWRDLPFQGADSHKAAAASRAAGAQGKFWEFHDAVYAEERRPNDGTLSDDGLRAIAREVGLDIDQFDADRNDAETLAAVDADSDEGISLGISGTPAFVIDRGLVVGAQPVDTFRSIIDEALAAAGHEAP